MSTGAAADRSSPRVQVATPAAARHVVRDTAGDQMRPDQLDTALLLISEVVGNAVRHGGPPIRIGVLFVAGRVRVEVDDENPRPPVVREPGLMDEGGRGMWLVDTMAAAWGVVEHPDDGKTVWFELAA